MSDCVSEYINIQPKTSKIRVKNVEKATKMNDDLSKYMKIHSKKHPKSGSK